jgi:hypothetical protein
MCAIDGLHCAMRTVPLEEVSCYYDHWALEVSAEEALFSLVFGTLYSVRLSCSVASINILNTCTVACVL